MQGLQSMFLHTHHLANVTLAMAPAPNVMGQATWSALATTRTAMIRTIQATPVRVAPATPIRHTRRHPPTPVQYLSHRPSTAEAPVSPVSVPIMFCAPVLTSLATIPAIQNQSVLLISILAVL